MGKGGESPLIHLSQLSWIFPGSPEDENGSGAAPMQSVDSDFAEE